MTEETKPVKGPKYALPEVEPQAVELTPEEETTAAQVSMGIDYTEGFTLKQALQSFNATRKAVVNEEGVTIPAEAQHLDLPESWFAKHPGTFKFRRPSFYDNLAIRVRIDELTRNLKVKLATAWLAEATAAIETLLVEQPEWFDLAGLVDPNVVFLIHHWYAEWSFRLHETP